MVSNKSPGLLAMKWNLMTPLLASAGKVSFAVLSVLALTSFLHLTDSDDAFMRIWKDKTTPLYEKQAAIWLNDYVSDIDALVVEGVDDNLSGLTWNNDTETLFAVINSPSQILELTPDGTLLRTVTMEGFEDVEAITWIGGHRFFVTDERIQSVIEIEVTPQTTSVSASFRPQVQVATDSPGNKGFEGVAWNSHTNNLWVAKERDPMALYQIAGFGSVAMNNNVRIREELNFLDNASRGKRDLSGLHFDERTGHLLVLSDQSRLLTEVNEKGDEVSSMDLGRLFAVSSHLPQPEGVTLDNQGNLYIVSEPNLFYRFKKPATQAWEDFLQSSLLSQVYE